MEDQAGSQTNGKKVAILLVGTAAVALAAAYYGKRQSAPKRPANSQLQSLLEQVCNCYTKICTEPVLCIA